VELLTNVFKAMNSVLAAAVESAYGENVYGADEVAYGGPSLLDTPIAGIPDYLPNTGREGLSLLLAIGLFAGAYFLIKMNYQRTHSSS